MAARLTVVVSQSSARDKSLADMEETLVAELMMTPGLDATMIGPIEHVQPEDTDFLCISSFNYNFVIVSWNDTEHLQQHWKRLCLGGEITSIDQRSAANGDPNRARRIMHFCLRRNTQIKQILAQLLEVLRDRNVKTIDIALDSASPSAISNTVESADAAPKQRTNAKNEHDPGRPTTNDADIKKSSQDVPHFQSDTSRDSIVEDDDDTRWQHLDQLVDDFDALDL